MDPTLAGLLHGCAAEPDDAAQRLILADWLDDHGQADRAAFVRLQCRLADWVPDVKERQKLTREQDKQLAAHRADWLGELDGLCHHVEFVRGLCRVWVAARTLTSKAFRAAVEAHAGTALIESLRVTQVKKIARVAASPLLARFPGLSFANLGLGVEGLRELLASPHLGNVAALDLSNNALGPAGAALLRASDLLPRLSRLELRNNALHDPAHLALLRATLPGKLRHLDPLVPLAPSQELAEVAEEWQAARGAARRVINSVGMEFVPVPAGSFLMGSVKSEPAADDRDNERPRRPVTLTRPFWLGRFAVPQAAYEAVTGENPAHFESPYLPVETVDFDEAEYFCHLLSALPAEKTAGRRYRLPTEAEWEHACRAGTFTPFHFGPPPSTDLVNYDGRHNYGGAPPGVYLAMTAPVGTYPPNAFGLCEMHGNVWEWTADHYAANYRGLDRVDPTGPTDGERRVIRGGCWEAIGAYCRAAHRFGEEPDTRDNFTGFRVVLETGA